ncbi:MAG: hypothetical protein K6G92_04270 [Bacteroidaceae bacterium]|nr:hypothetical protein [Bacteroidaceae bacterium]
MSLKEDNPGNQEGLSREPSPSEIISQMVDKLGELLHDHPNKNGNITINYYNSVGQRIDSVTTQNFSSDKWFKTSYHAPTENTQRPAPETVVRAIEKTVSNGLWFASTSWAVVYRVCQIKGYKKGFSQFVRDVSTWPFTVKLPFECKFDAIQKPVTSGKLDGMPNSWGSQGAHEQMVKLGKALLEEMEKDEQ